MAHVTYPNLRAEMARHGLTQEDVAAILDIGSTQLNRKFQKKSQFSLSETQSVQSMFEPQLSIDYLFADEPLGNNEK